MEKNDSKTNSGRGTAAAAAAAPFSLNGNERNPEELQAGCLLSSVDNPGLQKKNAVSRAFSGIKGFPSGRYSTPQTMHSRA